MRINYHPKRIQGEEWWALFCHGQMLMMIDRRERESLKQSSVQFDPAPSIKQYCSGHLQCNQCGGDDFGGANIILSLASQTSAETCPSVLCFFFYQLVSLFSESVVFGPWKSYIFGSKDKEEFMEMGPRWKRSKDYYAGGFSVSYHYESSYLASLVYYILHNKESGWRYSRRISRDHQLRGAEIEGHTNRGDDGSSYQNADQFNGSQTWKVRSKLTLEATFEQLYYL